MNIHSLVIFVLLSCCLLSCKLRIDNQPQEQETYSSPEPIEPSVPETESTLPPMSEIRPGYYAMLVTGNASTFVKGLYRGEATFASTNTPVIDAGGIKGNIKQELSFLYSQGLIRKLKVYFSKAQPEVQNYPLLTYSSFRNRLPEDSVSATYIIASNYQFESVKGRLEIHKLNERQIEGVLKGNFRSERGDSIQVNLNFKAIRE